MKSEDAIRTRASTTLQCFIRRLLAGAETKRRRELKKAALARAMVRRKKAEKEAKEQAIARKKAKRENARRALIRFQSAWRAHKARQVYLVKYVQRTRASSSSHWLEGLKLRERLVICGRSSLK